MKTLSSEVISFLSGFISFYRKMYRAYYVPVSLTENGKVSCDKNKFVSVVLMDLPKIFYHNLLITKLLAYGFAIDSLTFFHS